MTREAREYIEQQNAIQGQVSDDVGDEIANCAELRGTIAEVMRIIARAYPREYPTEIAAQARVLLTGEMWEGFITQQLASLTHELYATMGATFPNNNTTRQFDPSNI